MKNQNFITLETNPHTGAQINVFAPALTVAPDVCVQIAEAARKEAMFAPKVAACGPSLPLDNLQSNLAQLAPIVRGTLKDLLYLDNMTHDFAPDGREVQDVRCVLSSPIFAHFGLTALALVEAEMCRATAPTKATSNSEPAPAWPEVAAASALLSRFAAAAAEGTEREFDFMNEVEDAQETLSALKAARAGITLLMRIFDEGVVRNLSYHRDAAKGFEAFKVEPGSSRKKAIRPRSSDWRSIRKGRASVCFCFNTKRTTFPCHWKGKLEA